MSTRKELGDQSMSSLLHCYCIDKKEKKIFPIYKEIQKGAVAKSHMTNGLLNMTKYLGISSNMYYEALPHIWLCNRSRLNFLICEENLILFLFSVESAGNRVWEGGEGVYSTHYTVIHPIYMQTPTLLYVGGILNTLYKDDFLSVSQCFYHVNTAQVFFIC